MRPVRHRVFAGLTAALICSAGATPVFAHHSFGLFDMTKSLEIEGTVIKMEWSNPHCWLFIMTASPQGGVPFGFEMTSVGEMSTQRLDQDRPEARRQDKSDVPPRPRRQVRGLHGRRHDRGWPLYRPPARGAERPGHPAETR